MRRSVCSTAIGASPRAANLECDRVVGGDAGYNANRGLIRAELESNRSIAPVAFVQGIGGRVRCVGAADVTKLYRPPINEQPARCLRPSSQLLPVLAAFGDDPGAAAEISNSKSNTASLAGAIASPWFAERKRRLKNIAGNKGFRFLPGLVRVPAKRHQPVKDNLALLLVGDLDLSPLNKCAYFVHAAEQDELTPAARAAV
jgi:hypothetical protein